MTAEITMPARTWGDEPKAAAPAPDVLIGSDAGAPVPDVAAATRTAKLAQEAGWTVETTYALASAKGTARKGARHVHTVCLRLARGAERGYAIWVREDPLQMINGVDTPIEGKWSFGDALIGGRKFGARDLPARLRRSSEDVPGALPVHTPAPDGGTGGGAMVTGPSSPANPLPAIPPPPPPPVPGTWGALLPGDTVTGADGRLYEVAWIEPAGAWVGSGVHEVRIELCSQPDGRRIDLSRPAGERIHIAARGELAAVAAAAFDAGLTLTPTEETMPADQFSPPAPTAVGARMDPPTGQYGWYKLPDPRDGREGIYPRVTTIVKTLSDQGGLTDWKVGQALIGLAKRPDLIAMVASLDPERDKGKLREVIAQAEATAGSKAGANLGTAVDRFTERLDAGESIASMGVPTDLRPIVEAYGATLARYGLTVLPELTQRTVLNATLGYAGTWDRIVRDGAGRVRVLDVKTNKVDAKTGGLPDYHWLEWAQQFAMYARAEHMCSLDFTGYDPMPALDQSIALVLHLPLKGEPAVYEVDIIKGWAAAQASIRARAIRTDSRGGWSSKLTAIGAAPAAPVIEAQPAATGGQLVTQAAFFGGQDYVREALDAATTPDALVEVGRLAREANVWTYEHDAYATARYDLLRVASAPDVAALAALWDELHPAGQWTDEINAAAAARWEQLQPTATPVAA